MPPYDPTDEETRAAAELMGRGIAEAVRTEDFDALRAWVAREAPAMLPRIHAEAQVEQGRRAGTHAIAATIWAAAPLPSNGYRPRPLPAPGRNEPCPCGSGTKFKRCCGSVSTGLPSLAEEEAWALLVTHVTDAELRRLAADAALPPGPLAPVAAEMKQRGLADAARAALARRLEDPAALDARHEPALEVLFDLEGEDREMDDFAAWAYDMADRLPVELKSVPYRHLVPVAITARDSDMAHSLLDEMRRVNPEDPTLASLEVIALLSEGEHARAAERARFWTAWLRRRGLREEMEEAAEFLERAARDPEAAARELREHELPFLAELARLGAAAAQRPVRPYALEAGEPDAVFDSPPQGLAKALRAWRRVWPELKPLLVSLDTELPTRLLQEPDPWLEVLRRHPEAFDSLDVLDDLVLLAGPVARELDPAWDRPLLEPLLDRAHAIVRASLAAAPRAERIPWGHLENRPVLRLLARLAYRLGGLQREDEAAALYERILDWNPGDNHGHRCWLVDHYLRRGEDARALALAERFPDDVMPQTRFGRGLALWRLGRRPEAEQALAAAAADRPFVVEALLADDLEEPDTETGLVTLGSENEARIYAAHMQEAWLETHEALAFLRGLPKPARGRRRRRRRART